MKSGGLSCILALFILIALSGCAQEGGGGETPTGAGSIKDIQPSEYSCTDFDASASNPAFSQSHALVRMNNGTETEYYDRCLNEGALLEFSCSKTEGLKYSKIDCKGAYRTSCENGACIEPGTTPAPNSTESQKCIDGTSLGSCSAGLGGKGGQPYKCILNPKRGTLELIAYCEECGCPDGTPYCVPYSASDTGSIVPKGKCFEKDFLQIINNPPLECRLMSPSLTGHLAAGEDDIGLDGVDLGATALHKGKIYYFFGDKHGEMAGQDPYAKSAKGDCPELEWFKKGNLAKSMIDWQITSPGSHVPAGAFSLNGNIYVYIMHVPDWGAVSTNTDSYLVKSENDGETFELVEGVSWPAGSKFINIAPIAGQLDGEEATFFLATGDYGKSPVYLGYASDVEKISEYRYFTGFDGSNEPIWSSSPSDAEPVIGINGGREFSVQWSGYLGKYISIITEATQGHNRMLYASSENLWGPWETSEISSLKDICTFECYGGYIFPEPDGKEIRAVISLWFPYASYIIPLDLDALESSL